MITYDYHSNNDDSSKRATLRNFPPKYRPHGNDHAGARRSPRVGTRRGLCYALCLSLTKLFIVVFKYCYDNKKY